MSEIKMGDKKNVYIQKMDSFGRNILAFHAEISNLQNSSNQDVCCLETEVK